MISPPFTETELRERLDYLLSPVLSSRRTAATLALSLAALSRTQQDNVLHWIEVIDRTNYEMAYQFAAAAPSALARLDETSFETWIIQAMDAYDREGLHHGSQVFRKIDQWLPSSSGAQIARFDEHARILELFICGLSGRPLKLDVADEAWTDTETLHLPAYISTLPTQAENFGLYKISVAVLWAQGRFGTFRTDLTAACNRFADPARASALLSYLESLRLEACIRQVLPGIARDMERLRGDVIDERCIALAASNATVLDSLKLLQELYGVIDAPPLPYRTALRSEAQVVKDARIRREQGELAAALAELAVEHGAETATDSETLERFRIDTVNNDDGSNTFELRFDGIPLQPPENIRQLIDSALQDLGDIPEDFLQVTDDGDYGETGGSAEEDADDRDQTFIHGKDTYLYNEWDHQRRHYRKNWCVLHEVDVEPADGGFVEDTLLKYRPQVAQLKRAFEALRGEDRLLKRQPAGDDIDLDALVAAYADLCSGHELSDRLLTRRRRNERNLAALFMVDMSGSTKGWVNEAEREALVMLCEALEVLGDRYAIYGFSGLTRKRCEIYRIKQFGEPYDENVRRRIDGITPQDYTRMGAAIRHLTGKLNAVEARTKLLITLSDGKPDDYSDQYRGEYGIEDTRQALIEAHRSGVKPFCITIDHEARDYLPRLYGAVNWMLVDDVKRLPLKVADIYRRLTA